MTTGPKVSNSNTFCTLGKDEVASSNLASSSKKKKPIQSDGLFLFMLMPDLKIKCGADERRRRGLDRADPLFIFSAKGEDKCKQIWLAAPAAKIWLIAIFAIPLAQHFLPFFFVAPWYNGHIRNKKVFRFYQKLRRK